MEEKLTSAAAIYEMVTNRIIEELAKGSIPWTKPWVGGGSPAINYDTRRPYSFVNQIILGKPGEWMTFKQMVAHGGRLKEGAKSAPVVFYRQGHYTETDEETGERKTHTYPLLRYYRVFHIDDIEGVETKCTKEESHPELNPIDEAEKVISGYLARETSLRFYNNNPSGSAFYRPSTDEVIVPMLSQYSDVAEYYSTTFHEFVHSTGKATRCARGIEDPTYFGSDSYSREELVAEIGSAMICNRLGIEVAGSFRNSVAYIQSWIKALKDDTKMIVWASTRAGKAAEYIIDGPEEVAEIASEDAILEIA